MKKEKKKAKNEKKTVGTKAESTQDEEEVADSFDEVEKLSSMKHAEVARWLQDAGMCSLVPLACAEQWSGDTLSRFTVPLIWRIEKTQSPQERRLSASLLKLTLTPGEAFFGNRSICQELMDRHRARLLHTTAKSRAKIKVQHHK